jgi:uncharacterized membrane protein
MTIRLQQIHPALVHLPLTLLPLAVAADLAGQISDNSKLCDFGQKAIGLASLSALDAAASGLVAGEEVNAEGASRDMLMAHRNLNFVATVVTMSMAVWRSGQRRPNALYLGAGLAGVGVVAYTAYLGGKLVYDKGIGVEPAKGVFRSDAPKLQSWQLGAFFEAAAADLVHSVQHMIEDVASGKIVPTLAAWCAKHLSVKQ